MGAKMGPNYDFLFVEYVERRIFEDYQKTKPELYKRYINDVLGASSGTLQDLEELIHFYSTYLSPLKYTFEISDSSIPFLYLYLSISDDRITSTIRYKLTDTYSYISYHPTP